MEKNNEIIKIRELAEIKETFFEACLEDDLDMIRIYLTKNIINPVENNYFYLKLAVESQCIKIVKEMLNSVSLNYLPKDNKYAIEIATKNGDFSFVKIMLN